MLSARSDISGLETHIRDFTRAIDGDIKEESRTVMKGMVRDGITYTPPGSGGQARGKNAQRAGEAAISRDLNRMGFEPVEIKGFRMLNHVPAGNIKGRPAHKLDTPIRVPTKLNPKFADPEAHRRARLSSKHGGRVTRGGGTKGVTAAAQAFYVDRKLFRPMLIRLKSEVGRLASGWVAAARELGVPIPSWINRHGTARGSEVRVVDAGDIYRLEVVNHFPDGAESLAAAMQRRIDTFIAPNAIRRLQRQLQAKLSGQWDKTRK